MTTPWMQTFSGLAIPLDPGLIRADMIRVEDIVHGLGNTCRYNGQTRTFYSVAEHSILGAEWLWREGLDALAPAFLMHDSPEAYIGDIPRPIKLLMGELYIELEEALAAAIAERFGLDAGLWSAPMVKEVDQRILLDERKALLPGDPPRSWGSVESMEPLWVQVRGWSPGAARGEFRRALARYDIS